MHILIATSETQGQRKRDYNHLKEGEVVTTYTFECDGEPIDGPCGCRRAFIGLTSQTAGTTAKVADLEMSKEDYREMIREHLEKGGWLAMPEDEPGEHDSWIEEIVIIDLETAKSFPDGMIVERRGRNIQERRADAS